MILSRKPLLVGLLISSGLMSSCSNQVPKNANVGTVPKSVAGPCQANEVSQGSNGISIAPPSKLIEILAVPIDGVSGTRINDYAFTVTSLFPGCLSGGVSGITSKGNGPLIFTVRTSISSNQVSYLIGKMKATGLFVTVSEKNI